MTSISARKEALSFTLGKSGIPCSLVGASRLSSRGEAEAASSAPSCLP